jgi:hypothetical protein
VDVNARRGARILLGLAVLVWGAVFGLYGLIAVVYDSDAGSDASVGLFGREVDADLVGGVALALALGVVVCALLILRPALRRGELRG